jgi:hypothetical protein
MVEMSRRDFLGWVRYAGVAGVAAVLGGCGRQEQSKQPPLAEIKEMDYSFNVVLAYEGNGGNDFAIPIGNRLLHGEYRMLSEKEMGIQTKDVSGKILPADLSNQRVDMSVLMSIKKDSSVGLTLAYYGEVEQGQEIADSLSMVVDKGNLAVNRERALQLVRIATMALSGIEFLYDKPGKAVNLFDGAIREANENLDPEKAEKIIEIIKYYRCYALEASGHNDLVDEQCSQ